MKKKFNDIYKAPIDTPDTLNIGSVIIDEADPIFLGKGKTKTYYASHKFKEWQDDVKKLNGEIEYEDFENSNGTKVHIARPKGNKKDWYGRFVVGGTDSGGYLTDIQDGKFPKRLLETKNDIESQPDMTEPLNALIEEINLLKKSLQAQQKLIEELKEEIQQRPITESINIDLGPLEERIKKLETKKLVEAKPKGWKIERDAEGNLERIIPEE